MKAPASAELTRLAQTLAWRIGRFLERRLGLLERDVEDSYLAGDGLKAGRWISSWVRRFSRPAVSEKRLSLTPSGNVRYQRKTPYRDGTTHVIFEPLDFIARLGGFGAETVGHSPASTACSHPTAGTGGG